MPVPVERVVVRGKREWSVQHIEFGDANYRHARNIPPTAPSWRRVPAAILSYIEMRLDVDPDFRKFRFCIENPSHPPLLRMPEIRALTDPGRGAARARVCGPISQCLFGKHCVRKETMLITNCWTLIETFGVHEDGYDQQEHWRCTVNRPCNFFGQHPQVTKRAFAPVGCVSS